MGVVLHLSDTHFGTERPEVVEALVTLAAQHKPDVLAYSGDITQRARPEQFRAARAFADRLGGRLVAIPGNHDIPLFDLWARATSPYARYQASFGAELELVCETEDLLVIGVNSTRAWRHKHGEVSAAQIERVCKILAKATSTQLRIVMVHQPAAVETKAERINLLRGHAQALQAWATAGADLVLGGHIHLSFVLPGLEGGRPLWVVQAGTAVSKRTRSGTPNSVNLLRWGGAVRDTAKPSGQGLEDETTLAGPCVIERWDFDAERHTFLKVKTTVVGPHRDPAAV